MKINYAIKPIEERSLAIGMNVVLSEYRPEFKHYKLDRTTHKSLLNKIFTVIQLNGDYDGRPGVICQCYGTGNWTLPKEAWKPWVLR